MDELHGRKQEHGEEADIAPNVQENDGEHLPLALQQIHALVGKMADQRGGGAVVAKQDFPYGDGRGGGEDVGDEHGGADAAARRGSASENAGEDEGEEHGNGRADQRKRDGVP